MSGTSKDIGLGSNTASGLDRHTSRLFSVEAVSNTGAEGGGAPDDGTPTPDAGDLEVLNLSELYKSIGTSSSLDEGRGLDEG